MLPVLVHRRQRDVEIDIAVHRAWDRHSADNLGNILDQGLRTDNRDHARIRLNARNRQPRRRRPDTDKADRHTLLDNRINRERHRLRQYGHDLRALRNHRLHMERMRSRLQPRQIDKRMDLVRVDRCESRPRRAQLDPHTFRALPHAGLGRRIQQGQGHRKTGFRRRVLVVHHEHPKHASSNQSDNLRRQIVKEKPLQAVHFFFFLQFMIISFRLIFSGAKIGLRYSLSWMESIFR